ncbi:DUF3263 domain-containing protein [Gordonia terrae]
MTTTPNDDRAMLDLARKWIPYDGVPASEIWIQFGMVPDRYYAQIKRILSAVGDKQISARERSHLERLAGDPQSTRHAISVPSQDHRFISGRNLDRP